MGFGTSTPTAPRPGIGATMRIDAARIARARSFERFANCRTFTPGAGSISYCVTTGPVVRPTSSPSTRNVASAAISLLSHLLELGLRRFGVARRERVKEASATAAHRRRDRRAPWLRSPRRSRRRARRAPPPSTSSCADRISASASRSAAVGRVNGDRRAFPRAEARARAQDRRPRRRRRLAPFCDAFSSFRLAAMSSA